MICFYRVKKMDLGQIFTNKFVAKYMASLFSLKLSAKMLDPCFGDGAFFYALKSCGFSNITGYEIDNSLYNKTEKCFPDIKMFNEDFLSSNESQKYDGIIMNPPYIRQEKIDDLSSFGITKSILRKKQIFSALPATANLYMYFIVKAISMLKKNGEFIVIFPGSWLTTRNGEYFEKIIYSDCVLQQKFFMSGEIFEKNVLTDVIILKLKKCHIEQETVIKHIRFGNANFLEYYPELNDLELDFTKAFDSYGTVRRGMTTGYNSMYINPPLKDDFSKKYLKPIVSSPKEIMGFSTKNAKTDKVLILNSTDTISDELEVYIKKYETEIQAHCSPKTLYDRLRSNKNWFSLNTVNSSGILFSYFVRNDMKFVYNENNYLARDNFYIIKQKDNIDSFLLFALLNNYYTFYQLEKTGKKYGAGLLKLQRYDLENLTFPDVSDFAENDVDRLKKLSLDLILRNDASLISDITKIISRYSTVKYDTLLNEYHSMKAYRLGNSV